MVFANEAVIMTRKRRERDREKMKRRILDAAKELFVKDGFGNVSMRSIAAVIEYSPAALYRYFRNKQEILAVLRNEGFARFMEGQRDRRSNISDPFERLIIGGKAYFRFAAENPDYYQLMFCTKLGDVTMECEGSDNSMQSFELFRRNVAECWETGHFGEADLDTVTFSLWAELHGMAHLIWTGRIDAMTPGVDLGEFVERMLRFQLRPEVKK